MIKDIRFTGKNIDEFEILSNLAPKPFIFRGKQTRTVEGILQSVKVFDLKKQAEFWMMDGFTAKRAGRNIKWQDSQVLWWNEQPIDRHGFEYQDFLDELYATCYAQCSDFRLALQRSKGYELQHTIGNVDPERTILTVDEFIGRLQALQTLK